MGLFSFGSKEKEEPKGPWAEGRPEPLTGRALMRTFGIDDLDYLLKAYAPETWHDIGTILKAAALCAEISNDTYNKLDAITSRLDDISRRLDAIEQRTQDLPQRER